MKKIITIMLVAFISLATTYGQKCKPAEKVEDEFTGKDYELQGGKLNTARNMLSGTSVTFKFYLYEADGKNLANMQILYIQKENDASVNNVEMRKGTKFMLKTKNDEIIEFVAEESQNSRSKLSRYKNNQFSLSAEINRDQIQLLTENPVTMYRVVPEGFKTLSGDVSKRRGRKMMEQILCFTKK